MGGRLVEVHDEATGEGFEIGRVLVWEPGARLVFGFRSVFFPPEPMTEVEVRFDPVGRGTRVTLEHRGLDRLPPEFVKTFEGRAWVAFMCWFREHVAGQGVAGRPH